MRGRNIVITVAAAALLGGTTQSFIALTGPGTHHHSTPTRVEATMYDSAATHVLADVQLPDSKYHD